LEHTATLLSLMAFPDIDPVIFAIGPVQVRWYGLAYVAGILLGWRYARKLVGNDRLWPAGGPRMTQLDIDDFLLWATVGIVAGGRIGYILFYDFAAVSANPVRALEIWNGGMSFHGGLLGTLVAMILFARSRSIPVFNLFDVVCAVVPVGLFFGRLANFINSELWGKLTDMPWAVVFPTGGPFPRHPTQLYEAGLEGLLLCRMLAWLIYRRQALKQPGTGRRLLRHRLCTVADFHRILPGARRPDRLSRRRLADHGHGAVAADAGGWPLGGSHRQITRLSKPGKVPAMTPLAEKIIEPDPADRAAEDIRLLRAVPGRSGSWLLSKPRALRPVRRLHHRPGNLAAVRRDDRRVSGPGMAGAGRPCKHPDRRDRPGTRHPDVRCVAGNRPPCARTLYEQATIHMVETSERLRNVQRQTLVRLKQRISWHDAFEEIPAGFHPDGRQ
jgi:phosphatidylglycerol:prolipoprotein diacylglycerol transferase